MAPSITPPTCGRCRRPVSRLYMRREGDFAVFTVRCHGEVESCSIHLSQLVGATRMVGGTVFAPPDREVDVRA